MVIGFGAIMGFNLQKSTKYVTISIDRFVEKDPLEK